MSGLDTFARTAEQRDAADPVRSAWVAASAGSGKTSVLVDRVLRLLLEGTPPRRILCLTFTKAAAAEMANRLARTLGAWAVAPEADLVADIEALTGARPARDSLECARRLFAQVVDDPGGVRIQTIHAFCESVLKRFPLEARVPPHFRVLDERDARELLADAQNEVFEHARGTGAQAKALRAAVRALTAHMSETGFDELMGALAGERGKLGRALHAAGGLDGAVTATYAALGLERGETEAALLAAACADEALDAGGLRAAAAALCTSGSATDRAKGEVIAAWLAAPGQRAESFEGYLAAYFTRNGKGAPYKTPATKATLAAMADGGAALEHEAARLDVVRERRRAIRVAETTAALLVLGDAVIGRYGARKRAEARLDYDDLILKTDELLYGGIWTPWVLYKLDGGLDHVLIDEAQDTSPEQWAVVKALTEEFFGGSGAAGAPRTVFAVGDTKQSIFSFQGADPAEFERSREHFAAQAENAAMPLRGVGLATSFRATEAVLGVVDAVFADPEARDGLLFGDGTIAHRASRTREPGLVELWPSAPAEAPDEAAPWSVPDAIEEGPPLARTRLARHLADTIRGWIDLGERLEATGRPIRAGDIMVLVRRRGPFVDELVRQLKGRDVPVAGVDRMVVTEQLAVMDLIALGRFLLQPEDDLTLATVLRGPLAGLSECDLFDLAHDRGRTPLWRRLAERSGEKRYRAAHGFLVDLLAVVDFVPPYELYARVLGPGGGRRRLAGRLGVDAHDPIDEFLALALRYGQDHPPSLEGFLHWVEAAATEVRRDLEQSGRDEVRVMTVHGAKGLEAPVVILPDTLQKPAATPAVLWSRDEREPPLWKPRKDDEEPVTTARRDAAEAERDQEYRRLLYVALTRAADRLYVCGWHTRREPPDGTWYELAARAMARIGEPFDFDGPWGGTGHRFVRGDRPAAPVERPAAAPAAAPLPAWARRPPAPEPAPPRPLAPSRPEGAEPPVRSPLADDDPLRFRRGRLVHRLLQTLPDLPPEARDGAARRYLAQPAHGLDADARAAIAAETLAVLETPGFAALFGPGSMAEVPLTGVLGGRAVSGQVDRLVVDGDSVLVVDYKTNRPPPATAAEVPALYLRQMAAYRALLAEIFPDRTVRCALLWTDRPRLMELDPAALDAHAA